MDRSKITAGISALIEQHLDKQTCVWGSEVSIESLGRCRPDYLAVSASYGKFATISAIERAEVTVYEVKSCLADFKSGNGLNEVGDTNWLVLPYEVLRKIVERGEQYSLDRWSFAYPYPVSHGRIPDIDNLPAYEGQTDGWKIYWGNKHLSNVSSRPMPVMVYLWALLHSVNNGCDA